MRRHGWRVKGPYPVTIPPTGLRTRWRVNREGARKEPPPERLVTDCIG